MHHNETQCAQCDTPDHANYKEKLFFQGFLVLNTRGGMVRGAGPGGAWSSTVSLYQPAVKLMLFCASAARQMLVK